MVVQPPFFHKIYINYTPKKGSKPTEYYPQYRYIAKIKYMYF